MGKGGHANTDTTGMLAHKTEEPGVELMSVAGSLSFSPGLSASPPLALLTLS